MMKDCEIRTLEEGNVEQQTSHNPEAAAQSLTASPGVRHAGDMCDRCSRIPLDYDVINDFLVEYADQKWTNVTDYTTRQIASIETLEHDWCKLCKIFDLITQEYRNECSLKLGVEPRHDEMQAYGLFLNLGTLVINGKHILTINLSLVPAFVTLMQRRWKGYINVVSPRLERHPSSPLLGGDVSNGKDKWSVLRGWISICEAEHAAQCGTHQTGPGLLSGFQIIDCETRKVVIAPENCRYVAFSYVWGSSIKSTTNYPPCQIDDAPLAIRDAMTCTLALGLRYLWVDRYCIDQNDLETKHKLIQRMDDIYRGAIITIIHASGDGPNHGLPGVSEVSHSNRESVVLNDITLTNLGNDLLNFRYRTKWSTRGWTWQEGVLSARRLIFMDSQVLFQCRKSCSCEKIPHMIDLSTVYRFSAPLCVLDHSLVMELFPDDALSMGMSSFERYLGGYLPRQLSFNSDRLEAFMGILRYFWRQDEPLYNFWGLPFLAHSADCSSLPAQLTLSLLWMGISTRFQRRETQFPSWTWVGWQGMTSILLKRTEWQHKGLLNAYPILHDQDQRPVQVEEYVQEMEKSWDMYRYKSTIQLTGWMGSVRDSNDSQWAEHAESHVRQLGHTISLTGVFVVFFDVVEPTGPPYVTIDNYHETTGLIVKSTGENSFERLGVIESVLIEPIHRLGKLHAIFTLRKIAYEGYDACKVRFERRTFTLV